MVRWLFGLFGLSRNTLAPERGEPQLNPYSAVSIVVCENACNAVRKYREKRFLTGEAPLLPIRNCTKYETCNCKYQRHSDRRQNKDRRNSVHVMKSFFHGDDRRETKPAGRRKTD